MNERKGTQGNTKPRGIFFFVLPAIYAVMLFTPVSIVSAQADQETTPQPERASTGVGGLVSSRAKLNVLMTFVD